MKSAFFVFPTVDFQVTKVHKWVGFGRAEARCCSKEEERKGEYTIKA
jgi:hypothetical protein